MPQIGTGRIHAARQKSYAGKISVIQKHRDFCILPDAPLKKFFETLAYTDWVSCQTSGLLTG